MILSRMHFLCLRPPASDLPAVNHTQDKIHRSVNPIARRVDAQIIIIRMSPPAAGIKIVIARMLSIQPFYKPARFPGRYIMDLTCVAHPLFKGRCDKDTDMGDLVIGQNRISAPPHDNEILFFRHIAQQIALVKEYGVPLGKAVVPAEFPEMLAQCQMAGGLKHAGGAV